MSIPIVDNLMQNEIDQVYHLFDLCENRKITLVFTRKDFRDELLKTSDRAMVINRFHRRLHYALYSVPNGLRDPRDIEWEEFSFSS